MTTITAPTGLVNLSAPLPRKRDYTLLDAADLKSPAEVAPDGTSRWLGGAWIEGFVPGPVYAFDPCSSGTARQKSEAGAVPLPMVGAWAAYIAARCNAVSVGPTQDRFVDRLRTVFEALETVAVEKVLATGYGHSTLGPYLTDANMEVLTASAVSAIEGLALLEQELAPHGAGLIHATPAVAIHWAASGAIDTERGQLVTKLGTRIAVGAGYIDADPHDANGSAPVAGAGQEWAFVTTGVQIVQGEVMIVPADYAQALDRRINDVLFLAERPYLINWVGKQDPADTDNVQAGVLIDRTP